MKKWKKIYELFKQHPRLDDMSRKHIEICEKLLSLKQPHVDKMVYSKLWQESWIQTEHYRIFIENLSYGHANSNIEIYN